MPWRVFEHPWGSPPRRVRRKYWQPVLARQTVSDACLLLSYRRRVELGSCLHRRPPARLFMAPQTGRPPGSGGVGVEGGWLTGEQREHRASARRRVWRGWFVFEQVLAQKLAGVQRPQVQFTDLRAELGLHLLGHAL